MDQVNENADPYDVLALYEKLIDFDEVNSESRQLALHYVLDANWALVTEKKGEEALALAMELDKLLPGDFYVQNRILGAYRVMAEKAIEEKKYDRAYDLLFNTALKIRFDAEVMRTYLHLRTVMAQEAIALKDYETARSYLSDVELIASIDENAGLYDDEKAEAERLLKTLPPAPAGSEGEQ